MTTIKGLGDQVVPQINVILIDFVFKDDCCLLENGPDR